jgi:hypothetical protein
MGQTICFGCSCTLEEEDELRFLTKACESCLKARNNLQQNASIRGKCLQGNEVCQAYL